MIAARRFAALILVATVFSFVAECARAAELTADIQSRIAAVEKNLIPIVRIKGHGPGQLAERMRQIRVPGASVAVINGYKIEWMKGYGLSDIQAKTAVTPETLFQAGSVSKPVAAMAALKLVEQGRLTLDGDVNRQLKSWKVPENEFTRKHAVDLRGILSHTAGLTVHGFPGYAVGRPIPTLPQILDGQEPANTQPVRVDKVPGHGFRYAGGGTTIMQQLVIDVTARPFPDVVHDLVLSPLGMTSSSYEQPMPADRAARAASGYDRREKMIAGHWHIYPEMAAAGLWTTPSDVARYVIEVQLAHEGKSHKVLSRAMVEQMLTPQGGGEVGLGPFLDGKNGAKRFEHGGSDAGFICKFVGYLDRGQGAVVMTNSDHGSQLVGEILGAISVVYGWPDYLSPERETIPLDSKTLAAYQGTYSLGLFGDVQVEPRGGRLFAKSTTMGGDFELFFESDSKFFTEDPGITGRFVRDGKGRVAEILVNPQIHAKKEVLDPAISGRPRFSRRVWVLDGDPITPAESEVVRVPNSMRPLFTILTIGIACTVFTDAAAAVEPASSGKPFDVLIRGGLVYDGSGDPPRRADVVVVGDRIAAVGNLAEAPAKVVLDAKGLAVAPGFINMLSWSTDSLLADGRGQSEVRQGVTTQIMGEGNSWGPVNPAIKKRMKQDQFDIKYDIEWTTLSDYLYFLQRKGISQNVASFVGAATVREYVLGLGNKKPTPAELEQMCQLVDREMRDGALGIGSALEYAPAYYADTDELIALCKVAARHKGKYITHMRSEGERLLEGIDEVLRISREAGIPAEIYHFKAAGKHNWKKMDAAIARVEAAQRAGLPITADMYCYTAGAAPLTACIPPWAMEGGEVVMRRRLKDPANRRRILDDIRHKTDWPNFYHNAGSPENVLLIGFKHASLKPLQGKNLAQIARAQHKDPLDMLLDLLVEDQSSIGTAYFITAEENIRKLVPLPWISFGSDEAAQSPDGVFLKAMPHPRAYGNFARVLGKYVREEKLLTLEAAIRKLSHLPATNLALDHRGLLQEGYFADVVVFDPKTIADRATYDKPHQYAIGMRHVLVNGMPVLKDGEHTGAKPGRALWGPGKVDR